MSLSIEIIESLLTQLKEKSAEAVFTTLSSELNTSTKYYSGMPSDEFNRCCRAISVLIHPDKVDAAANAKAQEIFLLFQKAKDQLNKDQLEPNTSDLGNEINNTCLKLDLFLCFTKSTTKLTTYDAKELLTILIFPTKLPPEYSPKNFADIPESFWEVGSKNLHELFETLENKYSPTDNCDEAVSIVLSSRKRLTELFKNSLQLWMQHNKYSKTPSKELFIELIVLPTIKKNLRHPIEGATCNLFFNYSHSVSPSYSVNSEVDNSLKTMLGLNIQQEHFQATNTDCFVKNMPLKERQQLYISLKHHFKQRQRDYSYLEQCARELFITIETYSDQYDGIIGGLRAFYRKHFDSAAWNVEKQALVSLEKSLDNILLHMKQTPNTFDSLIYSYTPPLLLLPQLNIQNNPFRFALIQRLQDLTTAYNLNRQTEYAPLSLYSQVANKEKSYMSISREMGTFGLFGTFGHTKTRERCLHAIKQTILDDLENKATDSANYTVTVSAEVLKIMHQHNGRFWRFGKTSTQKRFENEFKLASQEQQPNDGDKLYTYNI